MLVALSAAYGTGGNRIGSELARRLGVPFVDRAIAAAVAERLDVSVADAIAQEEGTATAGGLLERLLAGFAGAYTGAPAPLPPEGVTAEDFHRASREAIEAQAATGAGVILGRGAAAALRDDPRVLRVRLTGAAERRVEQAMRVRGLDRQSAERTVRALDRAHADYLRRFYDVDIRDPDLYHLTLDATTLDADLCVELIARAAGLEF